MTLIAQHSPCDGAPTAAIGPIAGTAMNTLALPALDRAWEEEGRSKPSLDSTIHLAMRVLELAVQAAFGRIPRNQARSKGRGLEWGRADLQAKALVWIIGTTPDDREDFAAICDLAGGDAPALREAFLAQIVDGGVLTAEEIADATAKRWRAPRMREHLLGRLASGDADAVAAG